MHGAYVARFIVLYGPLRSPPPDRQQARVDLGRRLTELRSQAGLSQTEVAAHLRVRQATVSAWETGDSEPQFLDMVYLAKLYGVSLDALATMNDID